MIQFFSCVGCQQQTAVDSNLKIELIEAHCLVCEDIKVFKKLK